MIRRDRETSGPTPDLNLLDACTSHELDVQKESLLRQLQKWFVRAGVIGAIGALVQFAEPRPSFASTDDVNTHSARELLRPQEQLKPEEEVLIRLQTYLARQDKVALANWSAADFFWMAPYKNIEGQLGRDLSYEGVVNAWDRVFRFGKPTCRGYFIDYHSRTIVALLDSFNGVWLGIGSGYGEIHISNPRLGEPKINGVFEFGRDDWESDMESWRRDLWAEATPCPKPAAVTPTSTRAPTPARPTPTATPEGFREVGPILYLFLQGFTGKTETGSQPVFLHFQETARSYGADGPDFAPWSPNGGSINEKGVYQPNPSTCEDSAKSIQYTQLRQLRKTIAEYERRFPDLKIVVVGFSQGGVLDVGLLRYMAEHPDFGKNVAAIITFSSPVGGVRVNPDEVDERVAAAATLVRGLGGARALADLKCAVFKHNEKGEVLGVSDSLREMGRMGQDAGWMRELMEAARALSGRVFVRTVGTRGDWAICVVLQSCSNQVIPGFGKIYQDGGVSHTWALENYPVEDVFRLLATQLELKKQSRVIKISERAIPA